MCAILTRRERDDTMGYQSLCQFSSSWQEFHTAKSVVPIKELMCCIKLSTLKKLSLSSRFVFQKDCYFENTYWLRQRHERQNFEASQ